MELKIKTISSHHFLSKRKKMKEDPQVQNNIGSF
jgi:hypothetical protein